MNLAQLVEELAAQSHNRFACFWRDIGSKFSHEAQQVVHVEGVFDTELLDTVSVALQSVLLRALQKQDQHGEQPPFWACVVLMSNVSLRPVIHQQQIILQLLHRAT